MFSNVDLDSKVQLLKEADEEAEDETDVEGEDEAEDETEDDGLTDEETEEDTEEDDMDLGQSGISVLFKTAKNRIAKPKKIRFDIILSLNLSCISLIILYNLILFF